MKELQKLFEPFTSDGKKIIPERTDDWIYSVYGGYSTPYVSLNSKKLNQNIVQVGVESFFKDVIKKNINIEGNKIIGLFAISSERKLEKEEIFLNYLSLKTEINSKEISKTSLIPGLTYLNNLNEECVFLGKKNTQSLIFKNNLLEKTKIKKVNYIFNKKFNLIQELSSKTKIISLTNQENIGFHGIDKIIKDNIENTQFLFMKDKVPTEKELISYDFIPIQSYKNNFYIDTDTNTFYFRNNNRYVYKFINLNDLEQTNKDFIEEINGNTFARINKIINLTNVKVQIKNPV